jgi:hypothetical protein
VISSNNTVTDSHGRAAKNNQKLKHQSSKLDYSQLLVAMTRIKEKMELHSYRTSKKQRTYAQRGIGMAPTPHQVFWYFASANMGICPSTIMNDVIAEAPS